MTQLKASKSPTLLSELTSSPVSPYFLRQSIGFAFGRYQPATLEEVGHILRQSIRDALPTVKGPDDKQISIIDSDTGQIIGGAGAGTVISFVPLGPFASDAVLRSGAVPTPSNPFMLGKGGAEMVWGIVQMGVGGTAAAGGGGATMTGGGAIVGVPVCVAGVALATNGAATFLNGARTVILAVTQWPENASASAEPQPAMAGPSPAPTPAPHPAAPPPPAANPAPKPPAAPPPAVKPQPKPPAKPVAQAEPPPQPSTPPAVAQPPTQTGTKTFYNPPPGVKKPRNMHLAGKTHPKTGVPFDADGFPDFRAAGVVKKEVKIKFTGDRHKDEIAANKAANLNATPERATWHHHQDGETMQLVPRHLHRDTGHTGGFTGGK